MFHANFGRYNANIIKYCLLILFTSLYTVGFINNTPNLKLAKGRVKVVPG